MKVKPKKGMVVRHPAPSYRPIIEEGEVVPNTSYYNRRVKDGDLVIIKEEKIQPVKPEKSKKDKE